MMIKNKISREKTNNKQLPRISVICSAYNRQDYLEQCVNSILSQTFKNFELILIDNGSTDNTSNIVDNFAKKDKRVVAVHNPKGTTYGTALNQGISLAKGKYIGIVESDDWIDETMYEKLYNKIVEFDADVCLCSFTRLLPNMKRVNEEKLLEFAPKNKLFSIKNNPRMWYLHPCIWAKLYKKDILVKIGFYKNERYLDQPFIAKLFVTTDKLVCVPEYLYFYRQDNPNASSAVTKKDKSLIKIIDAYTEVKKILKKNKYYNTYKEYIYYHATYVIKGWLNRIDDSYKKLYLKKAYKYYKDLRDDKDFTFKFFSLEEKTFVKSLLLKNYKLIHYDKYCVKKMLGLPLYKSFVLKNIKKVYLLGCLIKNEEIGKDVVYTSYLCNLFRREQHNLFFRYYLLNIPIFQRVNLFQLAQQNSLTTTITKNVLQTELGRMIEVYALHHKVFPQFKNIYRNKSIVVCGAGPSLNYYTALENCIHIGVNKVFQNPKLSLDYSFLTDYAVGKSYISQLMKYRPEHCKKFLGQLLEQNHPMFIPSKWETEDEVFRYWVGESTFNLNENFNYDLTSQVLPCFYSVIFQAISFALWTNPQKIYLVGCDANFAGHFDGSPMASAEKNWQNIHHIRNYDGWNKLKQFAKVYYPDTEIISINPVGLKGMFHDVYTEEYLNRCPEIDRLTVEIIK